MHKVFSSRILISFFFNLLSKVIFWILRVIVSVWVGAWRSGDNFWELVLPFCQLQSFCLPSHSFLTFSVETSRLSDESLVHWKHALFHPGQDRCRDWTEICVLFLVVVSFQGWTRLIVFSHVLILLLPSVRCLKAIPESHVQALGFLISCRQMLLTLVGHVFSWDWIAISVPPLLFPSPSPSFILFCFPLRQGFSLEYRLVQNSFWSSPRLSLNSWLSSCLSLPSTGVNHQTLLEW